MVHAVVAIEKVVKFKRRFFDDPPFVMAADGKPIYDPKFVALALCEQAMLALSIARLLIEHRNLPVTTEVTSVTNISNFISIANYDMEVTICYELHLPMCPTSPQRCMQVKTVGRDGTIQVESYVDDIALDSSLISAKRMAEKIILAMLAKKQCVFLLK